MSGSLCKAAQKSAPAISSPHSTSLLALVRPIASLPLSSNDPRQTFWGNEEYAALRLRALRLPVGLHNDAIAKPKLVHKAPEQFPERSIPYEDEDVAEVEEAKADEVG